MHREPNFVSSISKSYRYLFFAVFCCLYKLLCWVGMKWFKIFFETPRFWQILKNTLVLSLYFLIVGFPFPIILALVINDIRTSKMKKFCQTVTYMPYFISTVVLVGMLSVFFSPDSGFVNTLLAKLGGSGTTFFMGEEKYFRHMYVWSGIWQSMGWNSVIYIAALSGVDQQLHEAAMIDGANRFQRVLHVDLPTILPTIIILLIMNCGSILNVGYEKVYLMQNDLNSSVSEIISRFRICQYIACKTWKIGRASCRERV